LLINTKVIKLFHIFDSKTNALLQKLKIKSPHIIYTLNEPNDFVKSLGTLPEGVKITSNPKASFDSLHWFVKTKADVDKRSAQIAKLLRPGVPLWCYYPKGNSKIQTDLTRDRVGIHYCQLMILNGFF
jgi:hypothetical protein